MNQHAEVDVPTDVPTRAAELGALAAKVDAAIAGYAAAFGEIVTSRTASVDAPSSGEELLEACRATLHSAIDEFADFADYGRFRFPAGTSAAEPPDSDPAILLRAIDAAVAAFAQARLSRSKGWVTASDDRLKLRRDEMYAAIRDYCRSKPRRPGRAA